MLKRKDFRFSAIPVEGEFVSRKALAAGGFPRPAASALRLTYSFSTRMAESQRNLKT
jgi:hypothetical protein